MAQLVSVEEYLHASFEYDAEYVEGRIVYRSLPQLSHSEMQGNLYSALREEGRSHGYKVWLSLRIRTKIDPVRFRVPDLCMTHGEPDEDIPTSPPFLCVEIFHQRIPRSNSEPRSMNILPLASPTSG
jgi:Uma2 family endonuclease